MSAINYNTHAIANGWEKYTITMQRRPIYASTQPPVCKTTTMKCYVNPELANDRHTICWRDVIGSMHSYEDGGYSRISTAGAEYDIVDIESGHQGSLYSVTARFNLISGDTVVTHFRSHKEAAQYHYFNSNGAYKQHNRMMQTLREAVEDGHINSGWLLAYDANYHWEALSKLAQMQRCKRFNVYYHISEFQDSTERGYNQLAEVLLGKRDKAGRYIEVGLREAGATEEV